jgi:recombination protein RecR
MLPNSITSLISNLQTLPGIGQKASTKLALDYINLDPQKQLDLLSSLLKVNRELKKCTNCFFFSEDEVCNFCKLGESGKRDKFKILVVQDATDIIGIENAGFYKGLYHVLLNVISPLDGISLEQTTIIDLELRLENLEKENKEQKETREIELIFYLRKNFNTETTIAYLEQYLSQKKWKNLIKISKLGHGLPLNFSTSSVDADTLKVAFENRK